MAAVMRILNWKAEGLRCPDHEIKCCTDSGDPHPVTLVQMPNGTGKTTTLELLRAALSGSAVGGKWESARIREFQKRDSKRSDGLFEVRLLLNNRQVTVRMEFDFENGQVFYKTTHGSGQRNGFHPPADFRRFMSESFVNFYVFDGELAQHLLDRESTNANSVVENLFQISSLRTLSRKVEEYWDKKTQHAGATEKRGLARRRNRLTNLRARREFLLKKKKVLLKDRMTIADQLKSKEDAYKHEIMKNKTQSEAISKAETKFNRLKGEARAMALETLETMRDPHAISSTFAQAMMALKTGLDRVKLPESAAREFFEELADEPNCVCGRPIDTETREVIRGRAGLYLGSDDVAFLNSMKSDIQDLVGASIDESAKNLEEKMGMLIVAVRKERLAENDIEELRIQAALADPAVERAQADIDELTERLSGVDKELEKFESKDKDQGDEQTYGIEVIEERIKNADAKLARISETIELKEKRDKLIAILDRAHQKAHKTITEEICVEANNRIDELMPYNNILIDRIDQCLMLQGQEGGSVGETLSVAWGFLATLFHRSEHELPFVVDSPAGSIDLAVRPKIGELIPKLTGQFIAFTISSERERFISPLKQASNDEVHFVTLFRKGVADLEEHARMATTFDETVDGLNVNGETFFNEFQLDTEEAV